MFNRYLLGLVLMALSGTVLSAPPVASLRINGSITPPSCTLNGLTENTYTFVFDISPGIFPPSGNLTLSPQTQNIEIVCDATTYLTLTATDVRAGTEWVTGQNAYGLGLYNTDTKIGYYTVRIDNATVKASNDASPEKVGIRYGSTYADAAAVSKTNVISWAMNKDRLASGQIFSADFTVNPVINNVMKNSAGDAELDGLAILTFAFGI